MKKNDRRKRKLQEEACDYEIERTPTTRYEPDYEEGLTSAQAEEHRRDGWGNISVDPPAQTTEEIIKENEPELLETISPQHLEKCLNGIEEIIDELPSEQTMFRLLEKAGCAKTVYDIGLDESAVLPSLRLAPYTRRRLSLLRISKMLDIRGE